MSALYMGDINYDLGNIEEAMQYYLEGKTEVEKTDDYKTGYLIMSSLGKLYLYRRLADYAYEACTKAYDYAVKDSNKRYQMASLKFLARSYCISNNLPKAIEIYKQCIDIALDLDFENNEYYYNLQKELASVYTNNHDFTKSMDILKSFPKKQQHFLLMGANYLMINEYDSAYHYLNKALTTNNIYTKRAIYEYLYELVDTSKYRKYLKSYCDSLLFYTDSVMSLDKGKEIIAYKEKYDHQKLIKRLVRKETTIRKQSEQLQDFMLQLHEYETRLMQNNRYMEELQEQIAGQEVNAEDIESYREQIDSLQSENGRLSENINTLQNHIAEYTSKLDKVRRDTEKFRSISEENLNLKQRERMLADYVVDNDSLVKELREKCRVLDDMEWGTLEQMCESTYGNFVSRLQVICPTLTKQELHLCILIKLRFSNAQMSEIFGVSVSSVSQKKFRLKKHLSDSLEGGLPEEMTLDRWVAEF